jgi:hypothetical protein
MKKLAEETGGVSVEVGHDRNAAGAAIERIGRAYPWVYRVELGFCEVPPSPPLRDDQLRVEVRRGTALAGVTEWVPFEQQASGVAIQSCAAAACVGPSCAPSAAPSAGPAPSTAAPPPAPVAPGPSPLTRILPFLAGAGLVALLLAFALRRRPPAAVVEAPAPTPPPPPPVPIPVLTPQMDAGAAAAAFPASRAGGRMTPFDLVILRGPLAGRRVPIGSYPFVVGADATAQLHLDIPEVSGRHATLEPADEGALVLVDLSTNGSYVDGQRVARGQRVRVVPGQLLGFSSKSEARLARRGE